MQQIIRILNHDIKCNCDVVLDEDTRWQLYDKIVERIEQGDTKGTSYVYITDASNIEQDIDVQWEIVNWKEIAKSLYQIVIRSPDYELELKEVVEAVKMYKDATGK